MSEASYQQVGTDTSVNVEIQSVSNAGDSILGITREEEVARSYSLATIINADLYRGDVYGEAYYRVMDFNNTVYRYTYVYSLLFFAAVAGLFCAVGLGLATAGAEFLNLLVVRPAMKIAHIFNGMAIQATTMAAAVLRPVLELLFPGSYRHLHFTGLPPPTAAATHAAKVA